MRIRRFRASIMLPVVFLGAMGATGCVVVPVRMKTRVEGPAGTKLELPKRLVVPGATTRAEVEEWYREFAVEPGVPNLFWGRFRKSSWAYYYAVGVGSAGASAGGAGGGRTWGVYNLLVTFDPNGLVTSSALVPEKDLQARLAGAAAEAAAPPLDLTQPLFLENLVPDSSDRIRAIDLALTDTGLTVLKYPPWRSRTTPAPLPISAVVPMAQIERVQVGDGGTEAQGRVRVELRFTEQTDVGRRVVLWAEPRWASVIVRWLAQVGLR